MFIIAEFDMINKKAIGRDRDMGVCFDFIIGVRDGKLFFFSEELNRELRDTEWIFEDFFLNKTFGDI